MSAGILSLAFIFILLLLFIVGIPVAFALGIATVVLMIFGVGGGVNLELIVLRMFAGANNFILLAVPFFLFAGKIMNAGGMTIRIFDFAKSLTGSLRGGLAQVNIVASLIFSGMSGTATADAAGLGAIEYKAMKEDGYPEGLSVGITAASSAVGPIIPPSVPLVIYAVLTDVSVGGMLIAGIFPGLCIGLMLLVITYILTFFRRIPRGQAISIKNVAKNFGRGVLALGTPAILVGGILSGLFTPTEAAAIAGAYALILGLVIYRELTMRELWKIVKECMVDTAVVLIIVAIANAYAFLIVKSRLPAIFAEQVLAFTQNPWTILILINVLLLIVGMFMETIAALTILIPILLPLAVQVGIDPIHLGVVIVFNLVIGLITPPFGAVLFVLVRSTGVNLTRVIKGCMPFYPALIASLILLTFIPKISLWLPSLIFGY